MIFTILKQYFRIGNDENFRSETMLAVWLAMTTITFGQLDASQESWQSGIWNHVISLFLVNFIYFYYGMQI